MNKKENISKEIWKSPEQKGKESRFDQGYLLEDGRAEAGKPCPCKENKWVSGRRKACGVRRSTVDLGIHSRYSRVGAKRAGGLGFCYAVTGIVNRAIGPSMGVMPSGMWELVSQTP